MGSKAEAAGRCSARGWRFPLGNYHIAGGSVIVGFLPILISVQMVSSIRLVKWNGGFVLINDFIFFVVFLNIFFLDDISCIIKWHEMRGVCHSGFLATFLFIICFFFNLFFF